MRNINEHFYFLSDLGRNERTKTFVIFFENPESSFRDAWWVTRIEIRVLKGLRGFVVCLHVKDTFLVKSVSFVHFRVQECNLCF